MEWHLMRGSARLGVLTRTSIDQPFQHCRFEPEPAFGEVAPLFAAELQSLEADQMEQWERDYAEVERLELRLVAADGSHVIRHLVLHIRGNEAWFRS